MEEQLAAMAAQMQQLKMDNSKIASRNSTLEKVLVFREGEIAELQDQNHVSCYSSLYTLSMTTFAIPKIRSM